MATFIGIFIALVLINILLLVFSTSLRFSQPRKKEEASLARKARVYSLKGLDTKYQEAV